MYALTICLYTDHDFGYNDTEFNIEPNKEKTYYFQKREATISALIRHFESVANSLSSCGYDNIKSWFTVWNKRIKIISKKLDTFCIDADFGNQKVMYSVSIIEKEDYENGSFSYEQSNVDVYFSLYDEDKIDWLEIEKMNDIETN